MLFGKRRRTRWPMGREVTPILYFGAWMSSLLNVGRKFLLNLKIRALTRLELVHTALNLSTVAVLPLERISVQTNGTNEMNAIYINLSLLRFVYANVFFSFITSRIVQKNVHASQRDCRRRFSPKAALYYSARFVLYYLIYFPSTIIPLTRVLCHLISS